MKKLIVASILTVLIFVSFAGADLTSKLVLDLQTQQKVAEVEVGASPIQIMQYRNSNLATITIKEVELNLSFDSRIVDSIAGVTSRDFKVSSADGLPGVLIIRLSASATGIKVAAGKTVELCRINFHVNQSTAPRRMLRLFNWSENLPSAVKNIDLIGITGVLGDFSNTILAASAPPEFSGINRVISANQFGVSNPGNTLVISWAKALDLTPPVTYQLSRKVQGEAGFQELATLDGNQLLYVDTGLENGREYVYNAKAIDSTTPTPNVQDRTSSVAGIPLDLNPPGVVQELSAVPQPDGIFLKWVNPTEVDFAGMVIAKSENRFAIESLGVTAGNPCTEGKDGVIYVGAPGEISFLDSNATHGVIAYYKVFTFDGYFNYSPGKITSAKALPAPTPVVETLVDMPTDIKSTTTINPISNTDSFTIMPEERDSNLITTIPTTTITTTTMTTTTIQNTTAPTSNGIETAPSLKIYFNGRPYSQTSVVFVPSQPEVKIEAEVPPPNELREDVDHYSLIVDGNARCLLRVESFSKNKIVLKAVLDRPLTNGRHVFAVMAKSSGLRAAAVSAAMEAVVTVSGGQVLLDPPITFPSPWDPKNGNLVLQYTLNNDANIQIRILSINGENIKSFSFAAGTEGGKAQINKISWDGKTNLGEPVSNGLYVGVVTVQGEATPLARFKITVARQ